MILINVVVGYCAYSMPACLFQFLALNLLLSTLPCMDAQKAVVAERVWVVELLESAAMETRVRGGRVDLCAHRVENAGVLGHWHKPDYLSVDIEYLSIPRPDSAPTSARLFTLAFNSQQVFRSHTRPPLKNVTAKSDTPRQLLPSH